MKKIELFTAECRLCDEILGMLTKNFPKVEIAVHRASECRDGSCCALAARYGVTAVPSLVVDGKIVLVGVPNEEELRSLSAILR